MISILAVLTLALMIPAWVLTDGTGTGTEGTGSTMAQSYLIFTGGF